MKLPSQRAAPAESPPQKLTTIFQFRNFRRDFTRQLDDIVGALNEQVFSFRTIGLLLQGEHHQVTEFVVKTPDLADDPDSKLHVEKARTRNGVTSFGAGPNFANNMLVFEVLHTYHKFDWSNLEMPMPIVGRCALAVGEERQIFPGPKFPMSHQLYGFGSELEKGSTHYHASSGGSFKFEAHFEQVPWIRQEPYSRIVLPGMYVPSFLFLSVKVAHRRILDMLLEEPLHLTNVRVEFQEFSCVPNKYLQSTEVRSKVLVDKKISMEIFRVNRLLTLPDNFYDCFIRTYGLKITVALSHKSGPSFNASAFVELNVAQEKYERIHEKDIFNPRYMGTDGIETCYGTHSSLKPFQTSEPTDDSLSSFSRLNADEATGKFQRYCFSMHNNREKGCFLLSADIMKGPKFADSRMELHSQLNSTSDSAEELHSQLSTSDNPLWDFVVLRKKQIQQSGIRLEGNMELALLVKVEDSLWSGDFLGGDHPVKEYLLNVDSPEILPETRDALKLKVILEEKAQRDQPGRYYLKWLQARCLRETRFATTSSQSYPTTSAQIDETLQQIPVDRVTRISDPNDPAHLFCRAHRMRLKAAKDKRCKPELDHLEQLLKIELIRLRERTKSPPQKLTTIFQFRNFRRNFHRQLDDIVGALNEQVFSFRTIGLLLQGEHHQVTEFVVKTPDLADDPDSKLHVEKARTRNGVTSFGAGPNFANNMLVFEVLHTYHTFDWSDSEMPMPIVGRCFLVAGEDKRVFPGPKFPMSHQLYGFESELEMGSTHDVAPNGKRLEFRAEFEQPSWILQEAYHRIVVPGMHVPSFLPLTLRIVDERCSDDRLKEPFHLTTIRVELQEFSCVPSKCLQSTEVRSQVLLEKKLFQEISMLNRHITIPVAMYDCVIPEVGPTFFTEGFIRTYGLKITVALSHKSGPSFNASAFVELNVAQEKYERIHEKDIFNPRSLGTEGTESYAQYFRVKLLQKFGPTDDMAPKPHMETKWLLWLDNQGY
ncbi:uncharacterized protein CXQ87_001994 [Candidozyma duobushaemuli]|uniref:Uncharacterized protein n=1 Tax=Candidozyma duobushaemuli TaxID=1231522 RepID=A0A2V1A8H4_9ASCO|nr:uncharacterized protein CXQ87_001994 [[Candida] duobushaemulonis]PVH13876.1 hypothetical protein CXQ87_001994 [[Candida] duobushaemulonis]